MGLHGAFALAARERFDLAVALDVGLVGDVPGVAPEEYEASLGGGPALVHKDGFMFYDARLLWALADTAEAAGVPFQHGVYAGYGSDALALAQSGVPSALVAVPTRYTHTAFEMIDARDVEATVTLLAAFLTREGPFHP
jgi:putative aminopeptidase FrvX